MKPATVHLKKQKLFFLLVILLTASSLSAQQDSVDRGAGYVKGGISFILGGTKTSDQLTSIPALTIAPGWRFVRTREFSLSLEAPISLGLSINDNHVFFGVELPATVNMNLGFASSNKSKAGIGWSLGVGKGYHYSYNEYYFGYDDDENDFLSLWGTVIQTAFYFRNRKRGGDGCSIRFHWISNFSDKPVRKDAIGVGLLAILD